jgi:hypothetical protein
VVLRRLSQSQVLPACGNDGRHEGIEGWNALFQFPRTPGVRVSKQGRDVDCGIRVYSVETSEGRKWIMHGSGPNWSYGTPFPPDVWQSISYEERTFIAGGWTITDARGKLANGLCWRSLCRLGESAEYWNVDEATAKILDLVIDGACIGAEAASPSRR